MFPDILVFNWNVCLRDRRQHAVIGIYARGENRHSDNSGQNVYSRNDKDIEVPSVLIRLPYRVRWGNEHKDNQHQEEEREGRRVEDAKKQLALSSQRHL